MDLCRRFRALAVAVCLLAPILGSTGASAQDGGGEVALQEVQARNELIAAQESLLNVYRCRFNVDTEVVPDGCADQQPVGGTTEPDLFEGTPTEDDIAVRDQLIVAQESLLNSYRCLFKIDTQIVPGGCSRIAVLIKNSIWIMNGDGENRRQIVTDVEFQTLDASPFLSSPTWSPDGTRIAFVVNYQEEPWDGVSDKSEIWMVNDDGTGLQNLTEGETPAFQNIFELFMVAGWHQARFSVILLQPAGSRHLFRSSSNGCRWDQWRATGQSVGTTRLLMVARRFSHLVFQWTYQGHPDRKSRRHEPKALGGYRRRIRTDLVAPTVRGSRWG